MRCRQSSAQKKWDLTEAIGICFVLPTRLPLELGEGSADLTPSKLFCPYFQVESKWLQLASTFTFFWDRPLKVVILL